MRGLSLAVASGGHSSSRCAGLSLSQPLLLRSTGSRRAGSVVVAHGPSCSVACGIFPDQGSNPCPLHWQADSQPLRHQGSPISTIFEEGRDDLQTAGRSKGRRRSKEFLPAAHNWPYSTTSCPEGDTVHPVLLLMLPLLRIALGLSRRNLCLESWIQPVT